MILSIYQTNKIWDLTDLFFTPIGNDFNLNKAELEYKKKFIEPFKIYKYSNYSGNFKEVVYDDLKDVKSFFVDNMGKSTLKTSRYLIQKDLINANVVFEYKYLINYKDFVRIITNDKMHTDYDFVFDTIYLNYSEDDKQIINFVNSESNELNQFVISDDTNINLDFLNFKEKNLEYFSSLQKFDSTTNYFVPQITGSNVIYNGVYKENPYLLENELLLANVQEKLVDFFKNTSNNIWSRTDKDRFIFSNDDVIIKYYANDVIEVSYYNVDSEDNVNVEDAFSLAYDFITKDKYITNEFYLNNYSFKNDKHIFGFDYIVNDFTIDSRANSVTENHITITVEKGYVTNYKKIVYNYESLKNYKKSIGVSFEELIEKADLSIENIKDAKLTFIDSLEDIDLYWRIEMIDGNKTYYSVE